MMLPELLAPAGSPAALHAAVRAGADAVYLGLGAFNARRNAENFSTDNIAQVCDYAHLRGVKVYITMNTIILPGEMRDALDCAACAYDAGADAFIVQDIGLMAALKRAIPDVRIHASTQMNIHSESGIEAAFDMGAARVTLARELSLGEISHLAKAACALGMQVEAFVHGALCVCYSGQCLMSSMIGGRSANRGLCAQACRLNYELVREGGRHLEAPGEFLLSPKDLCGAGVLQQLVNTGVASLKIEGRMKSPEYVQSVVSVYRDMLDRIGRSEAGAEIFPTDDERNRLTSAFSRGFTTAYLEGRRGKEIMSYQRPNNRGQFVGRIKWVREGKAGIACEQRLVPGDVIEIWTKRGRTALSIDEADECTSTFAVVSLDDKAKVYASDRVFRVRSADAAFKDAENLPRIPVVGSVRLKLGEPLQASFRVARPEELDAVPFGSAGEAKVSGAAGEAGLLQAAGEAEASQSAGEAEASQPAGEAQSARICERLWQAAATQDAATGAAEGDIVEPARSKEVNAEDVAAHIDRLGSTPFSLVHLDVCLDDGVGIGFSQLHHVRADALEILQEKLLEPYRLRRVERPAEAVISISNAGIGETLSPVSRKGGGGHDGASNYKGGSNPKGGSSPSNPNNPSSSNVPSNRSNPSSPISLPEVEIAALATNPECAHAAKRAGATHIYVPALNYRRGMAEVQGHAVFNTGQTAYPKRCIIVMPLVNHDKEGASLEAASEMSAWDGITADNLLLVQGIGDMQRASSLGAPFEIGSHIPVVNSFATEVAAAFGARRIWLSPELNMAQIEDLAAHCDVPLGIKLFGAQELMVTEHCLLASQGPCNEDCLKCARRTKLHWLKDRKGYEFPVTSDALGRGHIYNSMKLDATPELAQLIGAGVRRFMVDTTLLSPEESAQAVGYCVSALRSIKASDASGVTAEKKAPARKRMSGCTSGHLHRGVL